MKKKLLLLSLICMMVLGLIACGEEETGSAKKKSNKNANESITVERVSAYNGESDAIDTVWRVSSPGADYDTYYMKYVRNDSVLQYISFVLPKDCLLLSEEAPYTHAEQNEFHGSPFASLHCYRFDMSESWLQEKISENDSCVASLKEVLPSWTIQNMCSDTTYGFLYYGDRREADVKHLYESGEGNYLLVDDAFESTTEHGLFAKVEYIDAGYGFFWLAIDDFDNTYSQSQLETSVKSVVINDDASEAFINAVESKGTEAMPSELEYDSSSQKFVLKNE